MRVLIEKYIPFLQGVLESYADVCYVAPDGFTPSSVRDADALIVRTRTRVDGALLEGSRVRFVATATIGYDHIDTAYCQRHGIVWTACPGCNAQAVCDYVEEAMDTLAAVCPPSSVVGVVGHGHVGSLVAAMARRHGHEVLVCDPPLGIGVGLDEIACRCDMITFHTPLIMEGEYKTFHMVDAAFLQWCKPGVVLMNTARGGVVDEEALIRYKQSAKGKDMHIVVDCWEREPHINTELLSLVDIGSYHIAGYSLAGKMCASEMCLRALCRFFGLPALSIDKKSVPLQGDSSQGWLQRVSQQLKERPEAFEQLRKQYRLR